MMQKDRLGVTYGIQLDNHNQQILFLVFIYFFFLLHQYIVQLQFILDIEVSQMDQQAYLQRLRSIRDKYGCRDIPNYKKSIHQTPYPQIDFYNPENIYKQYHDTFANKPTLQLHDREKQLLIRQNQKQLKQTRSYSVYQKKIESNSLKKYQLNEAQIKRQQNFTHFIRDLDSRIEQKEKLLSQRFIENEVIIKKTENYNIIDNKNIQKYGSHKDLRPTSYLQSKLDYSIPKNSYQKSSLYLNKKMNLLENRQNEIGLKIQASPATKKITQSYNIIRNNENTPLTSPSLIQKKLEKNLIINREGWNTHKLQNIQQRIKSVLKQSNN